MKLYLIFYLLLVISKQNLAVTSNIICYYDASSENRKGFGQFTIRDLEKALEFCTHLIYGYADINPLSLELMSINPERDIEKGHYREITDLKNKYPHIKFLLSMGGARDSDLSNKYFDLLEAGPETQKSFIESVLYLLLNYKFDGLDVTYQFPRIEYNDKDNSAPWKSLKKLFTLKSSDMGEYYKVKFLELVQNLRIAFQPHDFILSLTVLPNLNVSLYFNISGLANNLDFITLQTFDFTTPTLNPREATYTSPLYSIPVKGNRNTHHNVDYQVNYWLSRRIPHNKLNVGIAAYGRAWKMSSDSNKDGFPKVLSTIGPAPSSYVTKIPGILTWMEICPLLLNALNANITGPHAPLISVLDPYRNFVTYAFRPADTNGEYGLWVSYDDPRIAAIKAAYVKQRNLGGIALYDISLDDYHGICNGDTFPMLRYIKYTFLS